MPHLHSRDGTPDDAIEAGPSGQSAAASRKRGRKQDDSLPPSRSRDIQRAFRARRAALLSNLELRVAFLERENVALRDKLGLGPDGPPLSGPEPEYQRVDGVAEGIEGTSCERPGLAAVTSGSPVPNGNGSQATTTTKRPRKRQSSGKHAMERDDAIDEATLNGGALPTSASLYGGAPSPLATLAHAAGTAEWQQRQPHAGSPAAYPNGLGGAPPPHGHYPYAASPNGHPIYQHSLHESAANPANHQYPAQHPYPPPPPNQQHPAAPNGAVVSPAAAPPYGWPPSAHDANAHNQHGAPYPQQHSASPAAYPHPQQQQQQQQQSQYGLPTAQQYPQHTHAYGATGACCAQPHAASPAGSGPPPPVPMQGQYGYPPHAPPHQHANYAASSPQTAQHHQQHQQLPPHGNGFPPHGAPASSHSQSGGHGTFPPTPVSHTPSPASAATSPAASGATPAANGHSALGLSAMQSSSAHGHPPHHAQQQQKPSSAASSGSSQQYLQQPGHASSAFTASPAVSAASPLSTATTAATPQTPLSASAGTGGGSNGIAAATLDAPREYLLRACGLSPRTVSRALAAGVGDADDEHRFAAFCAAVVEIAQRQPGPMKRIKLPRTDSSSSAGSHRQTDEAVSTAGGDKNSLEWNDELCCGGLIDCSAPIFDNTPSYPAPNGSSASASGQPNDASSPAAQPTLPPFLPLRDAFSRLSHALRKAPIELAIALSTSGTSAAADAPPDSSFAVVSVPGNREDGVKGTEELWVAEKAVDAAIEAAVAPAVKSASGTCQPKTGCC